MKTVGAPLFGILVLLTVTVAATPGTPEAPAALPKVESAGPPPADLAASLRDALEKEGTRATAPSGAALEVWLRREPPLRDGAPEKLGVTFGRLAEGALAGVVRLAAPWTDYRGQKIPAGLYTLRYAVEPADGYHMGVSAYRDFFLLVPAADDGGPGQVYSYDELVKRSAKAGGKSHPAVLALFPTPAVERPAPARNETGQPLLVLPCGGLTLGLVVEGTGEGAGS